MYEYMSEFKDVYLMELPNSQSEDALELWKKEIIKFKEYLEKKFNTTITEEQIRDAVKMNNAGRRSLKRLYEVMKHDPAPIKGHDLLRYCMEVHSSLTVLRFRQKLTHLSLRSIRSMQKGRWKKRNRVFL